MIDIAKRKLPSAAVAALVYISYCAVGWFSARGTLAYYGQQYYLPGFIVNDSVAFFIGGLLPFLLYKILSTTVFRMITMRLQASNAQSLKYGLDCAVIGANLLLFLLKFMYIAIPLYAPIVDIIIDPVITLGVVALYMWYAFYQNYIERSRYKVVLLQVYGTFLLLYGLLALINTFLAVA